MIQLLNRALTLLGLISIRQAVIFSISFQGWGLYLRKILSPTVKKNGAFTSRNDLKKVPRLGPKAFEQCAGFLRIPGAENPLDTSAVHPERYSLVEKIARDKGCKVAELIGKQNLIAEIEPEKYLDEEVGRPTLNDILSELAKPAPDPRTGIKIFEFDQNVYSMNDLRIGMILPGIVSNITRFGVFVDVGVKQDGLVHISEIANRFCERSFTGSQTTSAC